MKSILIALPLIFIFATKSSSAWADTPPKTVTNVKIINVKNNRGLIAAGKRAVARDSAKAAAAQAAADANLEAKTDVAAGERVPRFKRAEVLSARFGTSSLGVSREKASHLAEELNKVIFGQELVTEGIESTVTRYLEDFGHRRREPVHLNLMGFPGSGKTALIQKIEKLTGVKVLLLNAQNYIDGNEEQFVKDVSHALEAEGVAGKPVILAVDEIDKVPEIISENGHPKEQSSQFIGALNSMISEGKIFDGKKPFNVSNVLLVTMMNYPPDQIETFTDEVLEARKSYYDFSLEDFDKFDKWLREKPGAAHRILAKLYRANTVSRLAPNTLILQTFTNKIYRMIVDAQIKQMIAVYNSGAKADRKMKIEVDPSFNEFVVRIGVVPSSGARETINRVDVLLGRLMDFAQKSAGPDEHFLDRPRRVRLSMMPGVDVAEIEITPQLYRDGRLVDMEPFIVYSDYVPASRDFRKPQQVVAKAPKLKKKVSAANSSDEDFDDEAQDKPEPRLTKKEIRANRFPPEAGLAKGLAKVLKAEFFDQDNVLEIIESDVLKFMSRKADELKLPASRVLAAFPGGPALNILQKVSKETGIPLVRLNLAQFAGDEGNTVGEFQTMLERLISDNIGYDPEEVKFDGRYILALEGLEQLNQKDANGMPVARPVMSFIKDLLLKGAADFTQFDEDDDFGVTVNSSEIGKALVYLTYDLPVSKFGFEGDPRMTSVEDVQRAFKRLARFPADMKELLGGAYNPDVVSMLLPRLTLMSPYSADSYRKIVQQTAGKVVEERLHDNEGVNRTKILVDISEAYINYLVEESVIASEGATNTEAVVRGLMSTQLEAAMDHLPRDRKYSGEPLHLNFNFDPVESKVTADIALIDVKDQVPLVVLDQKVSRLFPSEKATGKMKAMRVETAAHEFGHAFAAVQVGYRIDRVLSVPLKTGTGGFVSFKEVGDSAYDAIANLYITLASRALERMVSNENPMDPVSVLNITQGSSLDIEMATETLYSLVFELGLVPHSGTLDHRAKFGPTGANIFPSIKPEDAQKLSMVLHDLENHMVEQFLKEHPLSWYVDKIAKTSAAGNLDEREFYDLIEYPYPGDNRQLLIRNKHLETLFADVIVEPAAEIKAARDTKVGERNLEERIRDYVTFFEKSVQNRFKFTATANAACEASLKTTSKYGF